MKKRIPSQEICRILGGLSGQVGLYVEDCGTGELFTVNPELLFPCASVIKIPIAALLLREGEEGRVNLDAPRRIGDANRAGGSGILSALDRRLAPTARDLAKLMIALSDNTATNELMDLLGAERFSSFLEEEGYHSVIWQRKMMDLKAIGEGKNNYMCAGETGDMLSRIARGELVSRGVSESLFRCMCGQQFRDKLPALVPALDCGFDLPGEIPEGKVLVGNKTGELELVQHDAGIFVLPGGRRYVIAMFTAELESDRAGAEAIARVSEAVYGALKSECRGEFHVCGQKALSEKNVGALPRK